MKLLRLRLAGFKSFCDQAEVLIEPGLTGIVGPNGCGKSNLVEALRWVMGETSSRAMRAGAMDDVIFAGNNSRPARNHAEVVLVVDNAARRAPAAFNDSDELEVARRIQRDLGSIYRVNGREARARDVQLLFADASTGARSPAMIRQGQIGELVNAKPVQRRAILEEAAGVAGLHGRRAEAEQRLRAAEQNLDRLEDVLVEIGQRAEALRRQARAAIRYRVLSADIRAAEALVLHLAWVAALEGVRVTEAAAASAIAAAHEAAAAQAQAARDQAVAAAALPTLRTVEARAGAGLQRVKAGLAELDGEERRIAERMAELARRLDQLDADARREERAGGEVGAALARLDAEAAELDAAAPALGERRGAALSRAEDLRRRLATAEAEQATRTRAAADAAARRRELERALRGAEERLARLGRDQETRRREIDGLAVGDRAGAGHGAAASEAEAAVATAEARAKETDAAVRAARPGVETVRARLAAAERELARVDAEARALARLLGGSEARRFAPVLDAIAVAPGFEAALAAALGDDLDAPLDEAAPAHWRHPGNAVSDPPLPDGAEPLLAQVTAPPALARRLAQIGVVTRSDAPALAGGLAAGQRLVSREGDLWRWDGFVAAAEAPSAAARRLAARNRLADLEDLVGAAKVRVEAERRAAHSGEAELRRALQADGAAREAVQAAVRRLGAARAAEAQAAREGAERAARLAAAREAAARLAQEADEATAARVEAAAALAALSETGDLEHAAREATAALAVERTALGAAEAEAATLAREIELAARRSAALERDRASWLSRADNAGEQLRVLAERRAEAEAERARLAERPGAIAAERRRVAAEIDKAAASHREAADALAVGETAAATTDKAARRALDALAATREAQVRTDERLAAAEERATEVAARIREALDAEPAEAARRAGLAPGAALPDRGEAERRLERLRDDRERLGAVNLQAEEELTETEAKRDRLIADRDDLVAAIKQLRAGIQSLDREARERLMAAFEAVDVHFRRLFAVLFGGGAAELKLVDSDDPLEAGLDIVARPPGKRPQSLSLLSGGEQALTAVALVFAVFLTNPAPVCVLDEVDAPLDDANVERFCDLLAEMAGLTETRFLVITHNPITMARMNRLYGVTMAERGLSQLVSVDLGQAERWREAG